MHAPDPYSRSKGAWTAAVFVARDLVAGRIDFFFDGALQLPLMRARNMKAYAVTSDTRLAQAPDIPTFSEVGPLGRRVAAFPDSKSSNQPL